MRFLHLHSSTNKPLKKNLKIYGVFKRSAPDMPISFSFSHDEALYIANFTLYLHHYEHFKLWCHFRNFSDYSFDSQSWAQYLTDSVFSDTKFIDPEDDLIIKELRYGLDDFASFMRMFARCKPLDLPHDRPDEYETYIIESNLTVDRKRSKKYDPVAAEHVDLMCSISENFKTKYETSLENARKIVASKTEEEVKKVINEARDKEKAKKDVVKKGK